MMSDRNDYLTLKIGDLVYHANDEPEFYGIVMSFQTDVDITVYWFNMEGENAFCSHYAPLIRKL